MYSVLRICEVYVLWAWNCCASRGRGFVPLVYRYSLVQQCQVRDLYLFMFVRIYEVQSTKYTAMIWYVRGTRT